MGTTGEYSDRTEWPVIAFEDKELAKQQVYFASIRANEIYNQMINDINFDLDDNKNKNSYDPNMKMDYTGTSYFIYETTLWENERND